MRIRQIVAAFSGAAALAVIGIAAPVVSAQEGRQAPNLRIPAGQRACSFNSFSFTSASGDVADPALFVSASNGSASRIWVLTLSSEAAVNTNGSRINLHWRIDGGGPVILGPEFFAGDTLFQTRTALGIVTLGSGGHSARPSYQLSGAGSGTVFFRCLTVETRTK